MIRMVQSKSAGHAKAYFSDALAKSDYFISDQELPGIWQGKLCARLGLTHETSRDDFFALCENTHPRTGGRLTPRTREERRIGYDINFHCPKSVSILHAFARDEHILTAFRDSVSETMRAIEQDAKARVRKDKTYDDRATGELVWAHFVHQTARPVEGFAPDPHLHSHCFVFNATWDDTEKKFKAGQFGDIKRDMPFYQAQFHKRLADKLTHLGYGIRVTPKSFEVEAVPQKAIDLFSKRTDEIGRVAKEKGITDAKELGELGAKTRSKKQKGATMAELKNIWQEQALALGKDDGDTKPIRFAPEQIALPAKTAAQALDHALLHCFERASVVSDKKLLQEACRYALGSSSLSVEDITKALTEDKRIIHVKEKGNTLCTTRAVLAEEKRMVDLAKAGQGKMYPLYDTAPPLTLKGQQGAAVAHILTTPHMVSIVRGAAGSGKTTLMIEAVQKIEAAGKQVVVVSPSADAARSLLRNEGFEKAETVACLLVDTKMQEQLKGQVLWVDEAGLLGTKDMAGLLELATRQNARIILGGDTRQHASVVRGDALRILNTVGGIRAAEVNKIYRQKGEAYRSAVEDLAKGEVGRAFDKLDSLGFIKSTDPNAAAATLVSDYLQALKKGKDVLVVCPTHNEGDKITAVIRESLRQEGYIGKKEISVTRLKNLNLTEAQKADPQNFEAGQVVQFNQNAKNFKRGSRWQVESVGQQEITVKNASGTVMPLPMEKSKHYDVFTLENLHLSKGDKVRITNGSTDLKQNRMDTGKLLTVQSVSKSGTITLKNELSKATYTLDKNFGHIAHAHCITSYASQGKTVDQVFIFQPAETFPATDAKQFYVSVSRAREFANIYTDAKEAMLEHASKLRERLSALELLNQLKSQEQSTRKRREKIQSTEKEQPTITKERNSYEPEI